MIFSRFRRQDQERLEGKSGRMATGRFPSRFVMDYDRGATVMATLGTCP